MSVFSQFLTVNYPQSLKCDNSGKNPAFEITFRVDGYIPFPQVILHGEGRQKLFNGEVIRKTEMTATESGYTVTIPAGLLSGGTLTIQIEGCRQADLSQAGAEDWIKTFCQLELISPARPKVKVTVAEGIKVYFGIHKHMHQPYYRAADTQYWDGEKDEIFGSRMGNYTGFVPNAVRQYADSGLPHAGLSTSWSGSLIEQLDRCAAEGFCGGGFNHWNAGLREAAGLKTTLGHPRMAFSAFGFYHPLMSLIPSRDIVRQIQMHREMIQSSFAVDASRIMFPPETAFHVRMIPALNEAGITGVIYDSIHRYRSCLDYPYAGVEEGLLPPNPAEQVNPPVNDWLQLNNVWAGSKIAPSLLKPEYVAYEDPDDQVHTTIAIPAERYIGNEDARGGFGALQYPDVLGQVYDQVVRTGSFDPKHPPFFLLHSDGDNHGGGADSYYGSNTAEMLAWLQHDKRFELTGIEDYLQQFPPDASSAIHVEPGSWSGADNGDPQFMKWFSRYEQSYSPDLNSWAVLTAFQNLVHAIEDHFPDYPTLPEAVRLLLTAETSCYWYWTGQQLWDSQITEAANRGWQLLKSAYQDLVATSHQSSPTIFAPWITPENPGGQGWGQGCLQAVSKEATVHTFIYAISGIKQATLILRSGGNEKRLLMCNQGPYLSETGALVSADYCTTRLPVGLGDIRYYIEATDAKGNVSRSALERVYLA